jgi:6-phosphogluconolactonase
MSSYLYVPLIEERKFLIFGMDADTGKLRLKRQIRLSARPYQLCADPRQRYLYQQLRSESYSAVASFRIDPASGDVTQIGEVELEADACYVVTDRSGRFLLAAYLIAGMVTVHPIGSDGAVRSPACDQRITEIYAHSILTDPSNRYAFVPHVAPTDSIHQFRFDASSGSLRSGRVPRIATTPGRGPRHLAFHPSGKVVYANEEQSSSVGAYGLDPSSGGLTPLQSLSTLPHGGFRGKNSTGSVRVHPEGKAVYVSNRGHNSIAAFAVDDGTGLLSPLGWVPSQPIPRPLGITSDGRFFFAGSDESDRLTSYRIDERGMLESLETYEVGEVVSWILPLAFD